MAQMNRAVRGAHRVFTHEGGAAYPHLTPLQQLRRSVMSCLLWEDEFYEDGASIADRIGRAAEQVTLAELAAVAIDARTKYNLRHVPLQLLLALIQRGRGQAGLEALAVGGVPTKHIVASTVAAVIERADELSELVALYWANGKRPLSSQMKRGLGMAFQKFDAYQLAKYNRDRAVKLRDVLFLAHAKPANAVQAADWKALVDGTLPEPGTWENRLSAGQDKRAVWTELLQEQKLGYLALLRNLRNITDAGVDGELLRTAILARKGANRVLPFRYEAAARAVPQLEPWIDEALSASLDGMKPLSGDTIVLVDVSGSMDERLSAKSDLRRIDAAATLASIVPGRLRVFTFSNTVVEVPPRRGMAGVAAVVGSQMHAGTYLAAAMAHVNTVKHDRLIVITDEQSHDGALTPVAAKAYLINVASATNGVGYGKPWIHIDGFSENVLRFIEEVEQPSQAER